eukprot:TRINITY_DN9967_c0_g1_i1.p1 TRINITY_DN9967_c0_g1~~TRINITY_DN9967_c0_g1_i1.p1  ORF type:complete len:325 (-),score=85.16 TRINITY_DN9967_c0_g1_i1:31-1005(-)
MMKMIKPLCLVALLIASVVAVTPPITKQEIVAVNQTKILETFFLATNGPSGWGRRYAGWGTPSPVCTWKGVTCNEKDKVVSIELQQVSDMKGPIPAGVLGSLGSLKSFGIIGSSLQGPIPGDIFDNLKLTNLTIRESSITGPLPTEMATSSLHYLDLSFNNIQTIPDWIGTISTLVYLDMGVNPINGPAPNFASWNLVHLEFLRLHQTGIFGTITYDMFSKMKQLTHLDLSLNRFNGTFPFQLIYQLPITQLYLRGNQFTGTLLPDFPTGSKLEFVLLYDNLFTGSIPNTAQNGNYWNNRFCPPYPSWCASSRCMPQDTTACPK